jgi:hypothetical protein
MAAGIPFMEVTGKKDVQNGGHSILKNDHGFWTLFVTFGRQNSLFLAFYYKSKLFQKF